MVIMLALIPVIVAVIIFAVITSYFDKNHLEDDFIGETGFSISPGSSGFGIILSKRIRFKSNFTLNYGEKFIVVNKFIDGEDTVYLVEPFNSIDPSS